MTLQLVTGATVTVNGAGALPEQIVWSEPTEPEVRAFKVVVPESNALRPQASVTSQVMVQVELQDAAGGVQFVIFELGAENVPPQVEIHL